VSGWCPRGGPPFFSGTRRGLVRDSSRSDFYGRSADGSQKNSAVYEVGSCRAILDRVPSVFFRARPRMTTSCPAFNCTLGAFQGVQRTRNFRHGGEHQLSHLSSTQKFASSSLLPALSLLVDRARPGRFRGGGWGQAAHGRRGASPKNTPAAA